MKEGSFSSRRRSSGGRICGLDPAEWLELEQLLEHRRAQRGGDHRARHGRPEGSAQDAPPLARRGHSALAGAETHREHVTNSDPQPQKRQYSKLESTLISIALAPAGSTQPSKGGALALTLSLGLGLIKARPPTKGCVFSDILPPYRI